MKIDTDMYKYKGIDQDCLSPHFHYRTKDQTAFYTVVQTCFTFNATVSIMWEQRWMIFKCVTFPYCWTESYIRVFFLKVLEKVTWTRHSCIVKVWNGTEQSLCFTASLKVQLICDIHGTWTGKTDLSIAFITRRKQSSRTDPLN